MLLLVHGLEGGYGCSAGTTDGVAPQEAPGPPWDSL